MSLSVTFFQCLRGELATEKRMTKGFALDNIGLAAGGGREVKPAALL